MFMEGEKEDFKPSEDVDRLKMKIQVKVNA